jgi:parallel beta-helix repeat protein
VDLFSIADNRIALGYEFTSSYILGETPFSYMPISDRARVLRDDYEYVYRHYTAKGVSIPFTKRAADSVRSKAGRSVLTSVRAWPQKSFGNASTPGASTIGYPAGSAAAKPVTIPADAIIVTPGQSIQSALDAASGTGKWVVLKKGIHTFPATLNIPSNITITGEGIATVLFLDPASGNREAMINKDVDLHDVTIRDLVIECNTKTEIPSDPNSNRSYRGGYNRGGIVFRSTKEDQMKNIVLTNITVQNGTYNGVFISGASVVNIIGVDLNENGATVPPGSKLNHNLLLTHCSRITVKDSRLSTSAFGAGLNLEHCNDVTVSNNEIVRNAYYGMLITESKNVSISNNLVEGNDRTGIMIEFLQNGCEKISVTNNLVHYNNGYALEAYAVKNMKSEKNRYAGNGNDKTQEKISVEKLIIM